MKKGKILLSFALLCSPFWLTATQNSDASQNSSAASSASKISSSQSSAQKPGNRPTAANSAPQGNAVVSPATKGVAQNSMPQSGSAANSTLQGLDDDNLGTINVTGKADLSTTEGTGSYTTGNMSTATGLNLSIRETPQSISVISNQLLKDLNLHNAEEALSKYATGISLNNDAGGNRIVSRGFYVDNIQEDGIASSVSSSVFGPLGSSKEFTDLEFYDRVEVLRGVAGLTQSNGEPGGTINLIRKRPSDQFGFNASLSGGSWDNYRGMIDVTDAVNQSGTARARLIGILSKTGSFKDYPRNGYREGVGVSTEFDVADKTLLSAGFLWQKTVGVYDIYGVPVLDNQKNLLNLPRRSYFGSNWDKSEYEKFNVYSELSHEFSDDLKAYARLNYTDSDSMLKFGALGGADPYNGTTSHTVRYRIYDNDSKEIGFQTGLDGKFEAFGQKHDFFLNGSLSNEKLNWRETRTRDSSLASLGMNIYNWDRSRIAQPDWSSAASFKDRSSTTIKQRAISLGTRLNLTDDFHFLLGGRFSKVTYSRYYYNILRGTASHSASPSKSDFTPYAGVVWDFADNFSWYASYAEIFKPQAARDKDGKILDPVVGYNLETGVKGEFFDGALNTNVALFQIIQKNRAMSDPLNTNYSIAEGKVRSRGVDAELQGSLTENWKLFAGYTFNRSVYLKTERTSAAVDYGKGANAKRYIPKHLFKLYTNYEIPLGENRKITLGTGVRYQSKTASIYRENVAYYAAPQKAYALWDANVGYHFDKHFSVNFAVKNITDKKYFQNTQNRVAGHNNYYGEPRNFMLTLNYTY